jgi:hypothetical protein
MGQPKLHHPFLSASAHGIRLVPLRRGPSVRPLPVAPVKARHRPRATSPKSCSVLVVLHHRDGLLRTELAGLLHPAPDLAPLFPLAFDATFRCFVRPRAVAEVHRVSRSGIPTVARRHSQERSPRCESPLEGFPSSAAVPGHPGRCLPAVVRVDNRLPSNAFDVPVDLVAPRRGQRAVRKRGVRTVAGASALLGVAWGVGSKALLR